MKIRGRTIQLEFGRLPQGLVLSRCLRPLGLLCGLSICGAVGVYLIWWQPASDRLERAHHSYNEARQTQGRLVALKRSEEQLQSVWKQLPTRQDYAKLIEEVIALAKHTGVLIPGMTHSLKSVETVPTLKVSMNFQAVGPYPAIRRFLYTLEASSPYVFIESLDAARSRSAGGEATVDFNIRLVAFVQSDTLLQGAR